MGLAYCDHDHETREEVRILPYANGNLHVCFRHFRQEMHVRRSNPANVPTDVLPDGSPVFPQWEALAIYNPEHSDGEKVISSTVVPLIKSEYRPYEVIGMGNHSGIWVALCEVAQPIIKHYKNCFYWDALTVSEMTHKSPAFYYRVGEDGTDIIPDKKQHGQTNLRSAVLQGNKPYVFYCQFLPGDDADTLRFVISQVAAPAPTA